MAHQIAVIGGDDLGDRVDANPHGRREDASTEVAVERVTALVHVERDRVQHANRRFDRVWCRAGRLRGAQRGRQLQGGE